MKKNEMHNKNILITGGTGFFGPWLIEHLLQSGSHVFTLVREVVPQSLFFQKKFQFQANLLFGDLLDFQLIQRILNEHEIDIVFHLGAQAIVGIANRSPLSTFKSNIEGTWNLLEACRLSPWVKKIIVASSDKAYGEQKELPYHENMPLQGRHPYDVSKSCADLIAQSYYHTYGLPVCITRCGNFFGGGDLHFNRIVPGTIRSLLHNERPIVRSNGLMIRDYVYVKDVVDAYVTLAEKMDDKALHGQAFNFSTDQPYSVLELVELICELMQKKHIKPIIQNEVSNEIPKQHLSSNKARTLLKWRPRYGITKGLIETIAWYIEFFNKFNKTSFPNLLHTLDSHLGKM